MNWLTLAAFAITFAFGVVAGHSWTDDHWKAKWNAHIAADKQAVIEAVAEARADEKAIAYANQEAAVKAAKVDREIEYRTRTIVKEVPRYVTAAQDATGCVTYGLVRVLDAATHGVDPATLPLPAGKSDDACAPVKPSDLARSVADNYGAARQNAAQLDALIASTRETADLLNKETTP